MSSDGAKVRPGVYVVPMCGHYFTDEVRKGLKCEMAKGHKRPCDLRRATKKALRAEGRKMPNLRMIAQGGKVTTTRAAGDTKPSTDEMFPPEGGTDDVALVVEPGEEVKRVLPPHTRRHVNKPPVRAMGSGPVVVGHKANPDVLR